MTIAQNLSAPYLEFQHLECVLQFSIQRGQPLLLGPEPVACREALTFFLGDQPLLGHLDPALVDEPRKMVEALRALQPNTLSMLFGRLTSGRLAAPVLTSIQAYGLVLQKLSAWPLELSSGTQALFNETLARITEPAGGVSLVVRICRNFQ